MTFDISKLQKNESGHLIAQTRDGRKVRVLITDLKDNQPIVGVVAMGAGSEFVAQWGEDGQWDNGEHSDWDLITPPATYTVTVFLWGDGAPTAMRGDLRGMSRGDELARKVITITEGEGL